jgi:hypothetical protein
VPGRFFGDHFLYLLENKKPLKPLILDAKPELGGGSRGDPPTWSAFRNIHKRYIPPAIEVIGYGNLVYQFMYRLIGEVNCSEFMVKATFRSLARGHEASPGQSISTMSVPTLISLVRAEAPAQHLRDALDRQYTGLYGSLNLTPNCCGRAASAMLIRNSSSPPQSTTLKSIPRN